MEQCKAKLCDIQKQKKADNVYISLFRGLSLNEYVDARNNHCNIYHSQPCLECSKLLSIAAQILEDGFCMLSEGFKVAFPNQVYKSDIALQRLLQMPLAAIRIGTPNSGKAAWFLIEYVESVNYVNFARFSESVFNLKKTTTAVGIDKDKIKALLGLATSDRERELIRFSVFKASGLTQTGARKQLGFERMNARSEQVEKCIEDAQSIREAIDKLAVLQDKSLLVAMGLEPECCSSESEAESDTDSQSEGVCISNKQLPSFEVLREVLQQGEYNWFTVMDFAEQHTDELTSDSVLEMHLRGFYSFALELPIEAQQKELLSTSHSAYLASLPEPSQCRAASLLNGEIVTDSESDNAEDYVGLTSIACERAKIIITRKRKSLARKVRRLKAKALAERRFLSRKLSTSPLLIAFLILAKL